MKITRFPIFRVFLEILLTPDARLLKFPIRSDSVFSGGPISKYDLLRTKLRIMNKTKRVSTYRAS